MFKEVYHEIDPESKLYGVGQKEIKKLADNYRKENYGFLDNNDPAYQSHKQREQNKTLLGGQIDEVFDGFPTILSVKATYEGAAGNAEIDIPYTIEDADFKAIRKEVRKNMVDMVAQLGIDPKEIKNDSIKREIDTVLKGRLFDKILAKVATDSANKAKMDTEAHYKAIPTRQPNFTSTVVNGTNGTKKVREFTPAEKAAFHGQRN